MLSFFRRLTKTKTGMAIMAILPIGALAGFAIGDIANFGTGNIGFGMGSSTLAKVGDQQVGEREMSEAMQRRLQDARRERPEADYATIAGDFETILGALIDQRTLIAFANKYDFHLSKRLIDAEIAQIPGTKGLNGQFSEQAYRQFLSQQRLTDAQVRDVISGGLLQRLILTPVATNARISVGMATPYASMMLESREGEVAAVPIEAFRAGLNPTDADLQAFYQTNRNRYVVPEQRVLRFARIGPEQVAGVVPSDQEIAAYYNANKATYAARDTRTISQAVVQDAAAANAIAAKAKSGTAIAAAAGGAAVTSLKDQTRQAYAGVAGDKAAAAVFGAAPGAVVGPVQSNFGWVVAKVEAVKTVGGKSLDQARAEISAKLATDKRKQAIEDMVDKVQNSVDEGSNFTEAAAVAKLPITNSPLITASGTSLANPGYKAGAEIALALKPGFEIAANDPPEIVSLPNDQGYVMVSPAQVIPSAPAPLASIRARVASDWISNRAAARAKAVGDAILAKAMRGVPLAQAVKEANAPLPPVRPIAARRIQIATAKSPVPPALQTLFTIAEGKSKIAPDPQGRGIFIVKLNKMTPGNALLQPNLISQMQTELQQSAADDYARQFVTALRQEMKATRNEAAIQALRTRLMTSGG
ncbi:MAG TPA: peptidyl-prolyl cis-trans isomerase [Sphingomicrobium sp.]|nr:peptidyl-prolyl cis-trans isomerase [Sphingomicrobium sp.]